MNEKRQTPSVRKKRFKGLKEDIYLDIFPTLFAGIIGIAVALFLMSIFGLGFSTGGVAILAALFICLLAFIFIKIVPYRNQFISWNPIAPIMLTLYVFIMTLSPILDPTNFYVTENILRETGETTVVIRGGSNEYYKPKYLSSSTNQVGVIHKIISFISISLFFYLLISWFKKHYFSFPNNFKSENLVGSRERNKKRLIKTVNSF